MSAALERYLTVSVDDGEPQDLRTAELLEELGLVATFYVPARNSERPLLDGAGIRELARRFELGGHSFSHRGLKGLPEAEIQTEVARGKAWLEETTGKGVVSFCYPLGKFDSRVRAIVKQCGFLGARTCHFNLTDWPADPFLLGLSTHAYSHSAAIQLRHALLEQNFAGIWNYGTLFRLCRDWERHFTLALDHVETHGGIAHLYFHSWEIDQQGQWEKLRRVLRNAASRAGFRRVTNGDLFRLVAASQVAR
jgi:peptidoglycan/xylan/chitin deacetylase (PgdA/CDA1 family)